MSRSGAAQHIMESIIDALIERSGTIK